MSGPISAGYLLAHGTLLLTQRALKEAQAMKREYGEVLEQLRTREEQLEQTRRAQQAARLERRAALRTETERQRARFERMSALAQTMAAQAPGIAQQMPQLPAPPQQDDDAAWSEHLRALESAVRELEAALVAAGNSSGAHLEALRAAALVAPTLDQVLSAYARQRQLQPGLDAAQTEQFSHTAARVLSRLELAHGATLPAELAKLARAVVLAPSLERAEALASELRLAVQREREARAAQHHDAEEARAMLAQLAEDAPPALLQALERVAAGNERMDDALRASVQQVLDTAAADRADREQEAAAYVLEQSLRDLGYEVEDIESTLFTDGGTVHFRRRGWDNYFVRLRVYPAERSVNFNVVRASDDEDSAERRRLDMLAEDRWCAEFPRLMQTLAARGLALNVTRRLDAGAVPVQVVDSSTLPAIHAESDTTRPRSAPLARRNPE